MPIKYKIDILEALKEKGFTSYRIRKEKIFGQKNLARLPQRQCCIICRLP